MNSEFSSPNLQDLESIVNSLLAEGKCACHIINPHKTRILMWKKVENNQEIYHLRIGLQRFTSLDCLDRNGEIYWKFEIPEVKKEKEGVNSELSQIPTEYGKSNSESTVNNESSQSNS